MEIKSQITFNNRIDIWLRILIVLDAIFPQDVDIEELVYLDYLLVHSWDANWPDSIHPEVPSRWWEIYIKRDIIQESLDLFHHKWLIEVVYSSNHGITYKASEYSSPFLEKLNENYSIKLINRGVWLKDKYSTFNLQELKEMVPKLITNNY